MVNTRIFRKIDPLLYVIFFVVIIIAVSNALVNYLLINNNHAITIEQLSTTNPSLKALTRLEQLVSRSRVYTAQWIFQPGNPGDRERLQEIGNVTYIELRGGLLSLSQHWDEMKDRQDMQKILAACDELVVYHAAVLRILPDPGAHQRTGKLHTAMGLYTDKISPITEEVQTELNELLDSRRSRASAMQNDMLDSYNKLLAIAFYIALLLIITVLLCAFIISRSFIEPVLRVGSLIRKMGRGEHPELDLPFPRNAVGEMMMALRSLISSSKQTARFAEAIGQGRFDQPYDPLSDKDVQGHALIRMRDRLKQASDDLNEKARQLELTNQYKSAFMANMSHELRTPLNSILILARLLSENRSENLDEKQVEQARIIYRSGNNLLTQINDILDLSKIEAGKVTLERETVEMRSLAREVFLLFKDFAGEKQIDFNVELEEETLTVVNDRLRLTQVLNNLLSNAIKFTPSGGKVTLSIARDTCHGQQDGANQIAISVTDNGIGIPAEKQQLVFDAFQQADGSTSRRYGGTGLGLAICRELAELMGGTIELCSEEGKGSRFTVFIPCEPATVPV